MRLIDADTLEEKGVEFTDTNVYVPIEAVWDAPTVEAEPVIHAKWLVIDSVESVAICSHCGRTDVMASGATHCRFCGAKMDQE